MLGTQPRSWLIRLGLITVYILESISVCVKACSFTKHFGPAYAQAVGLKGTILFALPFTETLRASKDEIALASAEWAKQFV